MSCNGKKKENPRVCSEELYRYIASHTSLTKPQVQECFKAYSELLLGIIESENIASDFTVALPHLGNFYLGYIKGRKNGSTYKFFKEMRVAHNEPSFYKLKFRPHNRVNATIKDHTKEYEEE